MPHQEKGDLVRILSNEAGRERGNAVAEAVSSGVLCLLVVLAVTAVVAAGRKARRSPAADNVKQRVVSDSRQLLEALEATGARGSTLVSLSRFLHFVPVEGVVPKEAATFPIETFDLNVAHRARVSPRNVLWLALEQGIARQVMHVLPPQDYRERRRLLSNNEPGIWLKPEYIISHELGSRRVFSDRPVVDRSDGPFIVAIDASYLDGETPPDPISVLSASGLDPSGVLLNRAEDNPDVSEVGRGRLDNLSRRLWQRNTQ
jgi:hypothetical protein